MRSFSGVINFPAGGIVFRIRGEDQEDVEAGRRSGVTLNLDVAFLHDVEKADLDFSGEGRGSSLMAKNAAIGRGGSKP